MANLSCPTPILLLMLQLSTQVGAYQIDVHVGDAVLLHCLKELGTPRSDSILRWQRNPSNPQIVAYQRCSPDYPDCVLHANGSLHLMALRLNDSDKFFCERGFGDEYRYRGDEVVLYVGEREPTVINTPPRFTDATSDVELYKLNGSTALVSYTMPSCVDDEEGLLRVECTPAPGQLVAINTNLVNCSCTDSSNKTDTALLRDPGVVEESSGNAGLLAIIGVLVVVVVVLVLVLLAIIIKRPAWLSRGPTKRDTRNREDPAAGQTQGMPGDDVDGANGALEMQNLLGRPAPAAAGQDVAGTTSSAVSQPPDSAPKNKGAPPRNTHIPQPPTEVDGVIKENGDTELQNLLSEPAPSTLGRDEAGTSDLAPKNQVNSKKALPDGFSETDGAVSSPPNLPRTPGPPPNLAVIHTFKAEVEWSYLLQFAVDTNKMARLQVCCNKGGEPSGVVFNIDPSEEKIFLEVDGQTEEAVGFDRHGPSIFQLHGENDNIKLFLLDDLEDEQILLLSSTDKQREMYRYLAVFGSTEDIGIEKSKGLCRR